MATAARDSASRAIAKIRKKRGSVAIPAPRSKLGWLGRRGDAVARAIKSVASDGYQKEKTRWGCDRLVPGLDRSPQADRAGHSPRSTRYRRLVVLLQPKAKSSQLR